MSADEVAERPTDDRATLIAGVAGPPGTATGGDLGMSLAPAIEAEARRVQYAAAGNTIPWPEGGPGRPRPPLPPDGVSDFGRYEILGELGRGGMGVVYKARQKGLDRLVAIKMILASHLANREQVERFYAEARAAARLDDPYVVAIHDVGEVHGQHYFAMEYVAGPSLAQIIRAGPLSIETAAQLAREVAGAVGRLHRRGVVHRDLKPSNILLDELGKPCITDFGLAKVLKPEGPATHSGAIVGTPSYMAPEQAAGRGDEIGPLSDVYALGAILYELLTGRPPFDEVNPLDTLVQVLESEPARPRQLRPEVPKALELICLKCLEREPTSRYATAEALADDLGRFLGGEPVEAGRIGAWARLRRWARREPALASRLGTMALCGAIIQANYSFIEQHGDARANRHSIAVVVLWALASAAFQGRLRRGRWPDLIRSAWAGADVLLYTLLVWINEGLDTAQVAGYFLLIAASGLWFRERLVWFTTGAAVVGYGALVLIDSLSSREPFASPYRHFVFATVLAVSGLIIAYQVRRVRALSLYYEHRPLP